MSEALVLSAAFLLDLIVGDPRRFPHPVRIIGWGISRGEALIRGFTASASAERLGGMVLVAGVVFGTYWATKLIDASLTGLLDSGGLAAAAAFAGLVVLTATTIAVKGLVDSAAAVIDAVRRSDLEQARGSLSMIVGRDTAALEEEGVLRAAIETLAENLSDGVVAPLFFFALGGLPLAMAYKAVNTLDSMIGYKSERYVSFGWAAARLDDLANYLPARITGLLIVAAVALLRSGRATLMGARFAFAIMLRDGRKHTSPNSGIPEAAMAGGLGVRLGGPSTYGGIKVEKPYIGDALSNDYLGAALSTIGVVRCAAFIGLAVSLALLFLRRSAW